MKLQEYFRLNNLSQKDFAVLVGVSEVHISQILRGIKNPSIQLIRRIETVTKGTVTVTDLFHPEAPSRLKNMEKNKDEKEESIRG
jgi:transcriptional regulator with XRE-family HTH domain